MHFHQNYQVMGDQLPTLKWEVWWTNHFLEFVKMRKGSIVVKEQQEILSQLLKMYQYAFCNDEPSALNQLEKTDRLSIGINIVAIISNKTEDPEQWSGSSPKRIKTNLNLNKAYVPKERFLYCFLIVLSGLLQCCIKLLLGFSRCYYWNECLVLCI